MTAGAVVYSNAMNTSAHITLQRASRAEPTDDAARVTILRNGLEASRQLAAANREAELSKLAAQVKLLAGERMPDEIRTRAAEVDRLLSR